MVPALFVRLPSRLPYGSAPLTLPPVRLVRDLERRLERLMDGLAGRVFRGNLHPVELGGRLVREADLTVHQTPSGPGISNDWTISINPADLQDVEVPDPLVTELAAGLEADRGGAGLATRGPVHGAGGPRRVA